MATLLSVNVGMPKDVAWQGRTVHTGVWKAPVSGRRMVRRLNVDGDGQGDLDGHGGEQRAVLVYQTDSYAHWSRFFAKDLGGHGAFGENFTVDGLSDDEVHIGDRYRIGEAEFEVSQPRVTCFRVGMRLGEPRLPALLVGHHRPGFYLRVITEGTVGAGDEIVRTRVGPHEVSVAEVDALLYLPDPDHDRIRAALDIPALSPGWQASFREVLAGGGGLAPIPVGHEPPWTGFRQLRVARMVAETDSITSIYLAADDDRPLPPAEAGQYLTVKVAAGVRSYSFSDPAAWRISVKREEHGAVSGPLQRLRPGALLDVAAARGEFTLAGGTDPVLLISAGIGVTPVLAMLHRLAADGDTRQIWWIHTTHDQRQYAFGPEIQGLLAKLPNAQEHVYYSTQTRLTAGVLESMGLPTDADAYVCGPESFMDDVRAALVDVGLKPDRVKTEFFAARAAINPGITDANRRSPHPPPGEPGTGPAVTFARSGLTVPMPDDGRSLLELAEACDVPTRWSCRTGVCHTCETGLLSGAVTFDPEPLEPAGPGNTLICCSRPRGEVVLDL
ncbi:MOSC and FAD-binding oxidoreductase domain-containing protein [Asanoa sp. WMMD1127]|uniref:MOSC and FAD-binding oxidoreductase domain-containing protein n=1 Tax=Asanoa sp. WMMD1127 TaxID=3016107 RepID=UPI002415DE40|nr:MOSC and FAD-binding oxidoreductase domain-containing protein [Asanoa sp. WMMD1127]MDG4824486.1 MOSC and FAD-binding oxidoreductase domain-containing protein [Asanoa sp. WMMD1127]